MFVRWVSWQLGGYEACFTNKVPSGSKLEKRIVVIWTLLSPTKCPINSVGRACTKICGDMIRIFKLIQKKQISLKCWRLIWRIFVRHTSCLEGPISWDRILPKPSWHANHLNMCRPYTVGSLSDLFYIKNKYVSKSSKEWKLLGIMFSFSS